MADLTGLRALITGGGRGIGAAIAVMLAHRGATVCIADLDAEAARKSAKSAEKLGGHALGFALDVTDRAATFELVASLTGTLGGLDILVNAAGIYSSSKFLDLRRQDFERVMDVNFYGVVDLMQAVLPGMQRRRFGRVINIASTAGKRGSSNQAAYSVSKHALVGLTRCVSIEMATSGITVNAICPGIVQTEMLDELILAQSRISATSPQETLKSFVSRVPLGRPVRPDEVGALAALLASREASGITGQSIIVDGGAVQA
jgi:NAD(P)-dependent dehydrogenase (short-subunit alcohol dehydrogenase family)